MKKLRSLLIDDEPYARMRLRQLLNDEQRVEVIGEAKDGLEAVTEILRLRPDLIFLDVRARTINDTVRVNYQIGDLEQGLQELSFFRAHRASLVNLRRVKEIRPVARSAFVLIMDDPIGTQIEVSERQARALRAMMPGL